MMTNTKFGTAAKREYIVRFSGVIVTFVRVGFIGVEGDTVVIGR